LNVILPILFAFLAAAGNGLFAYAQKQSTGVSNGLVFIGASALVACLLALLVSPVAGPVNLDSIRHNWVLVAASGVGLFLTYLGFNLLYSHFGVSQYVLYAVISIVTTTVVVGFFILKEPVNAYHKAAIIAALASVLLYSVGQSQS
jgi:drug/metabolite transporter (DMT)-like permease